MDYASAGLRFKLQKVFRYIRLYKMSRTLVKVQGQLHMRRTYNRLPQVRNPEAQHTVAVIGCGNYAYSNIAYFLAKKFGRVIGACMDADVNRAASLAESYRVPYYSTNAEELLRFDGIKLVYIASNHASHAEYAIQALEAGKHVYIEKPHVVNEDQLRRLSETMDRSSGRVFLGFNRPDSRFGKIVRSALGKEDGEGMYNWFVAGHKIDPDHWYFRPEEGGRVLGNLCHWTDFLLRLTYDSAFPVQIVPGRAQRSDCDIAVNYIFKDGSIGVITFSAKGHTFEGVSEQFHAHRRDCLLHMSDFERLTVNVVEKKRTFRNLYRDHGHSGNIERAYRTAILGEDFGENLSRQYVLDTAWFFLKTKEALERDQPLVVESFSTRTPVGGV